MHDEYIYIYIYIYIYFVCSLYIHVTGLYSTFFPENKC